MNKINIPKGFYRRVAIVSIIVYVLSTILLVSLLTLNFTNLIAPAGLTVILFYFIGEYIYYYFYLGKINYGKSFAVALVATIIFTLLANFNFIAMLSFAGSLLAIYLEVAISYGIAVLGLNRT